MPRIMRASLAGLALVAWTTAPAVGYSKFEHEQLTYYAFELARLRRCEVAPRIPSPVCGGFETISGKAPGGVPATVALGGVTRAVDYFSHPWRLVPEAEDCLDDGLAEIREGGCRGDVVEACQAEAEGLTGERARAACLDVVLADTLERVRKRRNKRLWRALAVHRNDSHFRSGAESQYNTMHARAIELAAEGRNGLALVAEAVAIHFLQDAFAPGHLAAPRNQYGDAYAGSLHDRYNSRGLQIWVDDPLCSAIESLRDPLARLSAPGEHAREMSAGQVQIRAKKQLPMEPPKGDRAAGAGRPPAAGAGRKLESIPEAKWISLEVLAADVEAFLEHSCDPDPVTYSALGDKRLLPGKKGPRRAVAPESISQHRISLLALAVVSIEDVLNATSERPATPLELCFHPPSMAEERAAGQTAGDAALAVAGRDRFWSPGLAVGRTEDSWSEADPCWPDRQEELIFGFDTRPQPTAGSRYAELPAGGHWVNGLQLAISYWGEERRRFEFAHDLVASEEYHLRDEHGRLRPDAVGQRGFGSLGYSIHHERDREMVANGAGLLYSYGIQFRDLDYYAALEPGIAHYDLAGDTTTRFRWSLRLGVGWSVVALEAIVEHGYEADAAGALEREWRPSLNARFRLAPSWFWWPFKR